MEETLLVVLVALGVGGFHCVLNFILWFWASRGGIFTALLKMVKGAVIGFISGLFLCAPIWYWIWIYDSNLINYFSACSGIFLTGMVYNFWPQVVQYGHPIDRIRESEDEVFFDKKYELVVFFVIVSIGAGIYFQYFNK